MAKTHTKKLSWAGTKLLHLKKMTAAAGRIKQYCLNGRNAVLWCEGSRHKS